jgi:phospholipid transport system transporter-binding protein
VSVQATASRADDGFAPSAGGERWIAPAALTFDNAGRVLERARGTPLPTRGIVDLTGLHTVDSSAVAMLLALRRLAAAQRREIAFAGVPPALASLAALYGVEDLVGR